MNEIRCIILIGSDGLVSFHGERNQECARVYEAKMEQSFQQGKQSVLTNITKSIEKLARGI